MSNLRDRFTAALQQDPILHTNARALIDAELATATGLERGIALWCKALLRSMDGPAFGLAALADVEEALLLLAENPFEYLQVLISAQSIALEANLVDRAQHYGRLLSQAIQRDPTGTLQAWTGRYLLGKAHGHIQVGKYQEADRILVKAITWHKKNIGPHNEHDRRCYLALCLLTRSFVQVHLAHPDQAQSLLDEACSVMPSDSWRYGTIHELTARIALTRGDCVTAQASGEALKRLGGKYVYLGEEVLARVALCIHDMKSFTEHVEEGLRLAAIAGDWPYVHTLETLRLHVAIA